MRTSSRESRLSGPVTPPRTSAESGVSGSRRLLAGALPDPVFSSATHGRACVGIDVFKTAGFEVLLEPMCHIVSVQLRPCNRLTQSRHGESVTRAISPGDVIVTPAGLPKKWQCSEPREWIAVRIEPQALQHFDERHPREHGQVELTPNFGTRDSIIADIARRLVDELRQPGLAAEMYVEALAQQLIIHLVRHHSSASAARHDAAVLPRHKIRRAEDYIDAHLDAELTVARIASELSMSPFHFAHLFQQATGKSPYRFVIERRITRAKGLLQFTDAPVSQVAQKVGCHTAAHFTVMFRRQTGFAPTEFRRHTRGG